MKAPPKGEKDKRIDEIRKILKEALPEYKPVDVAIPDVVSKDYKTFLEEEKGKKLTWYEKLCKLSEFLNLEPDKEEKKKIQQAIEFAHLRITTKGVFSFSVLAGVVIGILGILFGLLTGNISIMISLLAVCPVAVYFLMTYPITLAKYFRIKASEEIILAILYMVIYMRTTPHLEGAVAFAAQNLTGPLALDLRKLMWDVETRKYETIYEALVNYSERWKKNREFTEAIHLIRASMEQPEARRQGMLDEAINVILERTEEKMRIYSDSLRMPVMLIYALGITLPILIMVMFPILMMMLSELVNPILLVLFYDVALPIFIYYLSGRVLSQRPLSFSSPDISLHPKYSPVGKLKINFGLKSINFSLWPIGIMIALPFVVSGILLMNNEVLFSNIYYSLLIVWGIGLGISVVSILDSNSKIKLRDQINKLQDEFGDALFQLGNRMALGNPLEKAMEQTIKKEPDLTVSELFRKALMNVRKGGMAIEAAIFDKERGAIWSYPSRLIINVMRIVFEAAKKGTMNAALAAIAISRYIKQMRDIENNLKSMLSEATSSMRFLAMFLAPLIGGVTVTMAAIMMMIFEALGRSMANLETANVPGFSMIMIGGWGNTSQVIPLGVFQLVVGIYIVEICYLLSVLISGIENGRGDAVSQRSLIGWNLLIGLIVYTVSMMVTYSMFGSIIENLLTGGMIG